MTTRSKKRVSRAPAVPPPPPPPPVSWCTECNWVVFYRRPIREGHRNPWDPPSEAPTLKGICIQAMLRILHVLTPEVLRRSVVPDIGEAALRTVDETMDAMRRTPFPKELDRRRSLIADCRLVPCRQAMRVLCEAFPPSSLRVYVNSPWPYMDLTSVVLTRESFGNLRRLRLVVEDPWVHRKPFFSFEATKLARKLLPAMPKLEALSIDETYCRLADLDSILLKFPGVVELSLSHLQTHLTHRELRRFTQSDAGQRLRCLTLCTVVSDFGGGEKFTGEKFTGALIFSSLTSLDVTLIDRGSGDSTIAGLFRGCGKTLRSVRISAVVRYPVGFLDALFDCAGLDSVDCENCHLCVRDWTESSETLQGVAKVLRAPRAAVMAPRECWVPPKFLSGTIVPLRYEFPTCPSTGLPGPCQVCQGGGDDTSLVVTDVMDLAYGFAVDPRFVRRTVLSPLSLHRRHLDHFPGLTRLAIHVSAFVIGATRDLDAPAVEPFNPLEDLDASPYLQATAYAEQFWARCRHRPEAGELAGRLSTLQALEVIDDCWGEVSAEPGSHHRAFYGHSVLTALIGRLEGLRHLTLSRRSTRMSIALFDVIPFYFPVVRNLGLRTLEVQRYERVSAWVVAAALVLCPAIDSVEVSKAGALYDTEDFIDILRLRGTPCRVSGLGIEAGDQVVAVPEVGCRWNSGRAAARISINPQSYCVCL